MSSLRSKEEDINLKLMSSVRMSRLVIPHMKKNSGGSIINASISGGKSPNSGELPTTVSRAAGLNLTKSLANEFAKDNIRVNAIFSPVREIKRFHSTKEKAISLENCRNSI